MAISPLRLYFDGGCRPNPGVIEIAVVVRGVEHIVTGLGPGDNSDAEWMAAVHALHVARDLGAERVDLRGDSMLVISQARGTVPCRSDSLRAHLKQFQTAAASFETVRLRHIGRAQNLAGIVLARRHPR